MSARKCAICGERITDKEVKDTNLVMPYKKRYAHKQCFQNMLKITHQQNADKIAQSKTKSKKAPSVKKVPELKEGLTEEEFQIKKHFFETLKQILQTEQLEALHYKVADDYIKKYNFTYEGMTITLRYIFEVLEKEVKGNVIGLVPYYYTDAIEWYRRNIELDKYHKEVLKNKSVDSLYKKKTIRIKPPAPPLDLIDISKIGADSNEQIE